MPKMTITEALAEIKTIGKRMEKKQEFIKVFLVRQDFAKDPHEKDGGSFQVIRRERQAIGDLGQNVVDIRNAILRANLATQITVDGKTRTIEEWLVWRRDVAPGLKKFLAEMQGSLRNVRQQVQQKGFQMMAPGVGQPSPNDVIVNVNEQELAAEAEEVETILGTLDGQLSLKNATVFVEW